MEDKTLKAATDKTSDEFHLTRARIKLLASRGYDAHIIAITMDVKKAIVGYVLSMDYDEKPATEAQRKLLKSMFMNGNGLGQASRIYATTQDIIRLGLPLGDTVKHYQDAIAAGKYGASEIFKADIRLAEWLTENNIKRVTEKNFESFIHDIEMKPIHLMRSIAMAKPRNEGEAKDLVGGGIFKHMDRIGW